MTDLHYISATDALAAFRKRSLSPVELLDAGEVLQLKRRGDAIDVDLLDLGRAVGHTLRHANARERSFRIGAAAFGDVALVERIDRLVVRVVEFLLPPVVTGAIVALIGLNLAPVAKQQFSAQAGIAS